MRRFTLLIALATLSLAPAQDPAKRPYPHINLAHGYQVDAKWPERPLGMEWAAVSGLAVDAKDHVYVLTRTSHPVQVYDATGKFLRAWGGKDIAMPHQIRFDSEGNVWITDIGTHTLLKFATEGKLLQTIGKRNNAGCDEERFNRPTDLAFGPGGEIFVSDGYGNSRVVQLDKNGKFVRAWGELGQKAGQFSIPHSIACDDKGRVYVADRNNARVQVFDASGKFLEEWRDLLVPWGFTWHKGELWACGSSPMQWRRSDTNLGIPPQDQLVMKLRDGKIERLVHLAKGIDGLERPGEVNWLHCIAFDSQGNLYAGDIIGRRAQKFVLQSPTK